MDNLTRMHILTYGSGDSCYPTRFLVSEAVTTAGVMGSKEEYFRVHYIMVH